MTYELWHIRDGEHAPRFLGYEHDITPAALRVAALNGKHPDECAWVICPARISDENPEGITEADAAIIRAAHDAVTGREPGPVRSLARILADSIIRAATRASLPSEEVLAETHWQLRWV